MVVVKVFLRPLSVLDELQVVGYEFWVAIPILPQAHAVQTAIQALRPDQERYQLASDFGRSEQCPWVNRVELDLLSLNEYRIDEHSIQLVYLCQEWSASETRVDH